MEIFFHLNQEMQEQVFQSFLSSSKSPKERIIDVIKRQYEFADHNTFFRIVMNRENAEYLFRKFPEADPRFRSFFSDDRFLPFTEELKRLDLVKDLDSLLIVNLLKGIFLLYLHGREELSDHFQQVFDIYITQIVGFIAKDTNGE